MIEGNGPMWLFDIDSLTQSMNYVPVVAGTFSNDFAEDKDELHDEDDTTEESHDGSSLKENGTADQQVNTSRPDINTGSREVSTALPEVNIATPEDLVGPIPTTPHTRIHKDHPIEHVIGDVQSSVQTRRMKTSYSEQGFLSAIYERKTHQDLHTSMQEELLQFKLQKVWILVDLPKGHRAISTKWVYKNKKDERGVVIRNKARLVAQGHTQEEGIDYDEIEEEVYVCQPSGFEDPDYPNKVYKIDPTLFIKRHKGHILLVQIYVDDIIFGSTKKELCDEFEKLMKDKFQMSSMGELTFFLGLQVVLEKPLVQDGDAADFDEHLYRSMIGSLMYLTASRPDIIYLKGKPSLGLWYSKDSPLELVAYTDSNYAGATQDRRSTTGGCQFLGNRLISWECKKQTIVATSTTEAEYMAAASCYGQIDTDHNVADLLTKGFDAGRFKYLVSSIGMLNP
ncbi:putative ribonuclease H-like domain-containing protein [Tanacetum coccineum]